MISDPERVVKIQASPAFLVSLFHAASVKQMVAEGAAIWFGSGGGGMFRAWGGLICAWSQSLRSPMDLERISMKASCLFSKVSWFLLSHKLQQIQAKRLAEVLSGSRFTLVKEIWSMVQKEE